MIFRKPPLEIPMLLENGLVSEPWREFFNDQYQWVGRGIWDDINLEATSLTVGASAPDLITLFGSGSVQGLAFDGNVTTEEVHSGSEILHDYEEGSDIEFHCHWMPTTANAGNVKWQLECSWANSGDTFGAPSIDTAVAAATGTAWDHVYTDIADFVGTGKKIGSHFMFRFFRDPTDAQDTYPDDAVLLSVGVHYKKSSIGSREETIK